MILIIWNSGKAQECARSIEHDMGEPVRLASSLLEGTEFLEAGEYSAVIIDQWITEAEPELASLICDHLGMAVPVFVNFGISGVERILRELRAALSRRAIESALARRSAGQALCEDLKNDVTALLLSCGIALENAAVNDPVRVRLKEIEILASHIKEELAVGEEELATAAKA
ncbi:MAG TPA: hypothetical protein VFA90_09130 [Terriglobales bacterium]|nr:hypothetical protein [Terriglobales bacterium]